MSIQERIASLNLAQVGRSKTSAPPPPPPPPAPPPRSHSATDQSTLSYTHDSPNVGNQPNQTPVSAPPPPVRPEPKRLPLPPPRQSQYAPRRPSQTTLPALPPRQAAAVVAARQPSVTKRDSQESLTSTTSTRSSISTPSTRTSVSSSLESRASENTGRVKAPVYDPTALPPLPLKREPASQRPPLSTKNSSSSSCSLSTTTTRRSSSSSTFTTPPPPPQPAPRRDLIPSRPLVPPRPPPRAQPQTKVLQDADPKPLHVRSQSEHRLPSQPKRSALAYCMNKDTEVLPQIPSRPGQSACGDAPPPIPLASRPDLAALQASKPKANAVQPSSTPFAAPTGVCLRCRDFSAPDNHAARFPREGIPSQDVAWLSHQLTAPFPSPTDKARAICAWLHHNIAYNCAAFFSGNLQPSTPASTISSGLAVCEGYASLFTAFAAHAGLESIVVGGHGKGVGYDINKPPPPPDPTGHAWNVVKIDGGEWKLIDPCWFAGHLGEGQQYQKKMSGHWFTRDNAAFGHAHFPSDPRHFYLGSGRVPTWEEYWLAPDGPGEKVQVYSGCMEEHGISEDHWLPKKRMIPIRKMSPKSRVQFQFETVCEHWDNEKKGIGKPYVFILTVGGKDGRNKDQIPFQTNGRHWWCDVPVEDLGCPGQTVTCSAVTSIGGQDGRGWSVKQFLDAKGRKGMGWKGVAAWQL